MFPDVANSRFPIDSDQTIYLSSASSRFLLLTGGVLSGPRIKVAGFGNGNRIVIDLTFTTYSYDADTGILSVTLLGLINVEFDIGLGYSSDLFNDNVVLGTLGSQIWYEEAPPNSFPSDCSCKPLSYPPTSKTTLSSSPRGTQSSTPTNEPSESDNNGSGQNGSGNNVSGENGSGSDNNGSGSGSSSASHLSSVLPSVIQQVYTKVVQAPQVTGHYCQRFSDLLSSF